MSSRTRFAYRPGLRLRHRPSRARCRRPIVEPLESRTVLSSVTWTNPNGGDWDTATNWSTGQVPTAADDVGIIVAVSNPITHNLSTPDFANSLTSDDPITLTAGGLSIATTCTFQGTLTLGG